VLTKDLADDLRSKARQMARYFETVMTSHSPPEPADGAARTAPPSLAEMSDFGIVETYLGHYIEDLAAQVVGEDHVYSFLNHCVLGLRGASV